MRDNPCGKYDECLRTAHTAPLLVCCWRCQAQAAKVIGRYEVTCPRCGIALSGEVYPWVAEPTTRHGATQGCGSGHGGPGPTLS